MSDNDINNYKKQKLCKKYHEGSGKEKARQYYLQNREVIKKRQK